MTRERSSDRRRSTLRSLFLCSLLRGIILITDVYSTTAQLRTYFHDNYLPESQFSEVDSVLTSYPADITQGSPFDTGILNAITPQYKQIAAILSDLAFQGPRRMFLNERSSKQNTWAYCAFHVNSFPLSWKLMFFLSKQTFEGDPPSRSGG